MLSANEATIAAEAAALVICPRDGSQLSWGDDASCERGHRFPIVPGIPVLFGIRDPTGFASRTIDKLANDGYANEDVVPPSDRVDAVVQEALPWDERKPLSAPGREARPVPRPGDPPPSWRWAPAARRWRWMGSLELCGRPAGYRPVVIDPQLDLLLAATRVSRQLGIDITAICGDATASRSRAAPSMSFFPTPCSSTSPRRQPGRDG